MFFFNKYKSRCIALERELNSAQSENMMLQYRVRELEDHLDHMEKKFPFSIGQVVYDVQLRSSKGRFTKTKASKEHSLINEVVVDHKNYFNLVDRYMSEDVFLHLECAQEYLEKVCIE